MQIPVKLDPRSATSLQGQLFEFVRALILKGQLTPGKPMPATRAFSQQLGVSRNTVVLAYERLTAEGYLESRPTVGTFVSTALPEASLSLGSVALDPGTPDERQAARHPVLFQGRCQAVVNPNRHKLAVDFWVGRPDPHSFPTKAWRRLLLHNLSVAGSNLTEYRDPAGIVGLRRAIAEHLGPARGITATPDQVVVVNGSQEALNLVARLLVRPGTAVATECPCYQGAAYVLESYGAALKAVPVDDQGLDPDKLPPGPVSLAYVTPSHQYPLGVTLPLQRRLHLLDWAWQTGAYVVEDDYDSDFRHHGSPLTALAGLDHHGAVIYMGTFSKSIGAGIRLGYIVVPSELIAPARTVKTLLDNGHAWLDQATLADFISSGAYERHLRKIRHTYLVRRDCLVASLYRHFGGAIRLSGLEGGMHIAWHLSAGFPAAAEVQRIAENAGVGLYALESGAAYRYGCARCGERVLLLGYSSVSEAQIEDGIARLARALVAAGAGEDGVATAGQGTALPEPDPGAPGPPTGCACGADAGTGLGHFSVRA